MSTYVLLSQKWYHAIVLWHSFSFKNILWNLLTDTVLKCWYCCIYSIIWMYGNLMPFKKIPGNWDFFHNFIITMLQRLPMYKHVNTHHLETHSFIRTSLGISASLFWYWPSGLQSDLAELFSGRECVCVCGQIAIKTKRKTHILSLPPPSFSLSYTHPIPHQTLEKLFQEAHIIS